MIEVQEKVWMQSMRNYCVVFYCNGVLRSELIIAPDVEEAINGIQTVYDVPIQAIMNINMIP